MKIKIIAVGLIFGINAPLFSMRLLQTVRTCTARKVVLSYVRPKTTKSLVRQYRENAFDRAVRARNIPAIGALIGSSPDKSVIIEDEAWKYAQWGKYEWVLLMAGALPSMRVAAPFRKYNLLLPMICTKVKKEDINEGLVLAAEGNCQPKLESTGGYRHWNDSSPLTTAEIQKKFDDYKDKVGTDIGGNVEGVKILLAAGARNKNDASVAAQTRLSRPILIEATGASKSSRTVRSPLPENDKQKVQQAYKDIIELLQQK